MKPIIGLFDKDQELTQTLNDVYQLGFEDDQVKVIDQRYIDQNFSSGLTPLASAQMDSNAGKVNATVQQDLETLTGNLVDKLSQMGISDDEARFYVDGINHGGKLVIVEADEAQTVAVTDILRRAQATNL